MRTWLTLSLLSTSLAAQSVVSVDLTAAPGVVDLGPGYTNEPAQLYGGTLPGPVIRATVGDTLRVRLCNQLGVPTILHAHGQPVRLGMDGIQRISRPEIANGQEFTYEFDNLAAGTYWYHPHSDQHHQLNSGLQGVLIVDPPSTAPDPAFDVDEIIVLDDWDATITGGTFFGHLLNGKTSDGQTALSINNGQTLRLRFINTAARTNYVIALDGHPMTVTHKDGQRMQQVATDAIPIGIGERYDVLVNCNNPGVWSLAASTIQNRNATVVRGVLRYSGETAADPAPATVPSNLSTGALISYAQLASYYPSPISATPDRTYPVAVSAAAGAWMINGESWPAITPMQVSYGETIQFNLTTSTPSPNHLHPMHMHGHFMRLMGTAGGTTHAPQMDTILVMPSGQTGDAWSAQWVADNPGSWLYHCHEMMHMSLGMMTLVDYTGDFDSDNVPDASDKEPTIPGPVVMISDQESDFQNGNAGAIDFEWEANQWCNCFMSWTELVTPLPLGTYGDLRIDPNTSIYIGSAQCNSSGDAQLPYQLPASPGLAGLRLYLQAVGSNSTLGPRLGTHQSFIVR
ncbi:MAG: FtsP/CotA-like multicopper oxidase with cupredoxin domain [Planctomycetota bacterium]|jgi:FtsP/CotA-like multicopper oxidase with cupredoxin domain